jgi:hypothetical protein
MIAQRSNGESEAGFERKPDPPEVISVTTRHARCVMRIPGPDILRARRNPIPFEGKLVKVMD